MPDRETLLRMYGAVTTAKQCDDKVHSLLRSGSISLMWLSARGQEVMGAAIGIALEREDYLVTFYRGLPEQIAKGMVLREIWAEWLGRATGVCRGKGGGTHLIDPDVGVMLNSGIVGGGLPVATGLALSSKLRGDGRVTVCTFGDGAGNQGSFHEALNLASVWQLPVVFVCQNNHYAETTAFAKATAVDRMAQRAAGYRMPGITVDGNDPVAMYDAMRAAVDRARAGGGPTLLEADTYRLMGHYMLDNMSYMPEEELAAAVAADPVPRFRAWLIEQGHSSEEDLATMDKAALAEIEEAYAFALASPEPSFDELGIDVVGVA